MEKPENKIDDFELVQSSTNFRTKSFEVPGAIFIFLSDAEFWIRLNREYRKN